MSAQSPARSLPVLEASPVEQAAEMVEDFVLQRSLEALGRITFEQSDAKPTLSTEEAVTMAASLTEQSRLVDEEISRYLAVQKRD